MNKLLSLGGLLALSVALFLGVFSVVQRPLVVGEIQKNLDYKMAYARSLPSPKIVIFAGSNGRYSHRCELLTEATGLPCVNASVGLGIGLDFQLDQWMPLLKPGDVVYMPLEYSQYRFSKAKMQGGLQNTLMIQSQRDYLWSLDARRIAAAYGSFDLPFLIHGLGEMLLDHRGFRRRSSLDTLTRQGDESGHTRLAGRSYEQFLRNTLTTIGPGYSTVPEDSDAISVLEGFLHKARLAGVSVIGGLPTVPDSVSVEPRDIERLRRLYEGAGQRLIDLPNRSRYPLNCFFDWPYHLNEECQKAHSSAVGLVLADLLRLGGTALVEP